MNTERIIEVFKLQGTPMNEAIDKDLWFDTLRIKLTRDHLIQVIKELNIWEGIIPTNNLDSFLSNNSWSDLVNTLNKALLNKYNYNMGI